MNPTFKTRSPFTYVIAAFVALSIALSLLLYGSLTFIDFKKEEHMENVRQKRLSSPHWKKKDRPEFRKEKFEKRMKKKGPKILGLRPEEFLAALIIASFFIGFAVSVGALIYYLRRKSQAIGSVFQAIKAGRLDARLPVSSTSGVFAEFNTMADEMEALVNRLQETESARKEVLGHLTHDIHTPLASMRGLLENLIENRQKMPEVQQERFLSLCLQEVMYFNALVQDLYFFASMETPSFKADSKPINLSKIILDTVESLPNKGIIELKLEDRVHCEGDQVLLKRLVTNALNNAIENSSSKAMVRLSQIEGRVVLEVVNDGNQLTEEQLGEFGLKQGTRKYQKEKGKGFSIGMGALIMTKIVEIHQGTLKIENTEGDYSVSLKILLPNKI